jgi:hypothetical protein
MGVPKQLQVTMTSAQWITQQLNESISASIYPQFLINGLMDGFLLKNSIVAAKKSILKREKSALLNTTVRAQLCRRIPSGEMSIKRTFLGHAATRKRSQSGVKPKSQRCS